MDTKTLLAWFKQTIEGNFTAAVLALKKHIFTVKLDSNKVEVTNPTKLPKEFAVKVLNPDKDYSTELASLKAEFVKSLQKLSVDVLSTKPSGNTKVTNFKDLKFPEFPKTIEIANQKDTFTVKGIDSLEKAIKAVGALVEKLPTSYPEGKEEVKVNNLTELQDSFDKVIQAIRNIKTASFTQTDVRGIDPKQYVPVRLTDGEEFYNALNEFAKSTQRSYNPFTDANGNRNPALIDAQRHLQVDVITMPPISIPSTTGGATEAKQDDIIQAIEEIPVIDTSSLATSAKQLPDNHQVTVSNQPTEFPLPAEQITTLTPPAAITGFATEAKQDTLYTEIQKKTEPGDNQQVELINMFRLLLQAIQYPAYTDRSTNQIRTTAVVTSATLAANQDIRTVTNLTNIGSFTSDHLQRMSNMTAWTMNNRSLIT